MDTPAARLEKKFKRKHRLLESDIGKTEKAALQRLLKEGRVLRFRAYYLAGYEPASVRERKDLTEAAFSTQSFPADGIEVSLQRESAFLSVGLIQASGRKTGGQPGSQRNRWRIFHP
jgi:hypothetical protein